ncbi:MAG: radical SAM protein [Chloroflexi bacterium]|nr:radical SAM protein [Chloroflexota bacterium]MCL5075150.1 radical SAM protein [Chloroflexota bacterium]
MSFDKDRPRLVRVSSGTATRLSLDDEQVLVHPTTAYLMVGERCRFDCHFCAQARSSHSRADALSRITWPTHPLNDTVEQVQRAYQARSIERCCLQVIASQDYLGQTREVVAAIRQASEVPLCASISLSSLKQVEEFLKAGVDIVGLSLDAACERVFARIKAVAPNAARVRWHKGLQLIEQAAAHFRGHIATHLIVGLDESEEEMVTMIRWLVERGVIVGLFAFTPIRGTAMESASPPPIGQYRRIQAAHYLLKQGLGSANQFHFVEGRIVDFGLDKVSLRAALADGEAFRTSGCPGCNRPYYNERPAGLIYNYPRPLTPEEAQTAFSQMEVV